MKRCPACQQEYPDDRQFCQYDGADLVSVPAGPLPMPQPAGNALHPIWRYAPLGAVLLVALIGGYFSTRHRPPTRAVNSSGAPQATPSAFPAPSTPLLAFTLPKNPNSAESRFTRISAAQWREIYPHGEAKVNYFNVVGRMTLGGISGIALQRKPDTEVFIPDPGSGSDWVGLKSDAKSAWNIRWREFTDPVAAAPSAVSQVLPGNPADPSRSKPAPGDLSDSAGANGDEEDPNYRPPVRRQAITSKSWVVAMDCVSTPAEAEKAVKPFQAMRYPTGILWMPDYASLDKEPRWLAYVGPFAYADRDVAHSNLLDVKKSVPGAYAIKVDTQGPRETFNR